MKKLLTSTFLCFVAIAAMTQTAGIEVSYDWTSYDRTGKEISRQMTLLTGPGFSKFYNKAGEYVDSLRLTPSGIKQYQEMAAAYMSAGKLSALPQKTIYQYIVKNHSESKISVYDGIEEISEYKFMYVEPLEAQEWNITNDSTSLVSTKKS